MTNSVRHIILQRIVSAFANYREPFVDPDPAPLPFFSYVNFGPLADEDFRRRYTLGVVVGQERETFIFPYIECKLLVNLEFRIVVNRGDVPSADMAEDVLTRAKQVVFSNRTWGGMALDTKTIGNEIDLYTNQDKFVIGLLVCEVQYRHSHLDPTNPDPDV